MIKNILSIILILTFSVNLYGQADQFNFTGNGARAAGMGYAFTGISDDATAISWNSAGLTQLYSPEASVIARVGFNSAELTNFENRGYDAYDIEMASNFNLNFISVVFPFEIGNRNVVAGIAYRNQYDFNSDVTEDYEVAFVGYTAENITEGGINTISPSIAIEINELLSVGTAVNIITGSQKSEGFDEGTQFSEYMYELDFSGLSFDIGVLLKPSDIFTIGANLNLPYTLVVEEEGEEYDLEIPFFFSVGTGIHVTDNFLVGFDFHSRNWSKAQYDGEDFSEEDINSIHVGLEYLLQSGEAVIPLRAGFYTNPTLTVDFNGDQITTNVFSAGLGLVMESIIIDVAFEFGGMNSDFGNDVVWEETNNRLTIGSTIHFGN